MTMAVSAPEIQGNIEHDAVPSILIMLRSQRLTGRITFTIDDDRVDLAVNQGNIVYAVSNDPDRRMGEVLLRAGKIRFKDYLDSVNALLDTGERQGQFLVNNARLEKNELKKAVREHIRELIYWVLSWPRGSYQFKDTAPAEEEIQLHLSTHELILRGMSACDRYSKLRDTLAPWNRICRINGEIDPEEAKKIRLKEEEASVISLVNGDLSIADIIKVAPLSDFRAMQILYGLKWAQIIRFSDRADSEYPD